MDNSIICASCSAETPDSERCATCGAAPYLMDRYVLLSCVGSGSFGTTYRARRLEDGEIFAIKEMMVRRAESLKVMELFEREAKILERLSHPGVPRYIEDFVHEAVRNTAFYLVQEYVVGKTLSEAMAGPTQPDQVFQVCRQVLEILIYLHSFSPPVIHRDIKLDNIMRRDDGGLVLIDFGSVRAALDSTVGGSTVAGTFGYMAPEQFLGRALPQTDVYGVGACAVAMLSNQDPQSLLKEDRTLDLSQLRLSPHFDFVLKEMLKVSSSERPDARAALELLQTPIPPETRTYTTPPSPGLVEVLNHPLPRPVPEFLTGTFAMAFRHLPSHRTIAAGSVFAKFAAFLSMGLALAAAPSPWAFGSFVATFVFAILGKVFDEWLGIQKVALQEIWKNGEVGEATITAIREPGLGPFGKRFTEIEYEYYDYVSQMRYCGQRRTRQKLDHQVGQILPTLIHPEHGSLLLLPADFQAPPPVNTHSGFLLSVQNDDGTTQEVEVSGTMRVGRTPGNDIVIPSSGVSRHHAQFEFIGDRLFILDLGSANGVQNNDRSVENKASLEVGDVIKIGNSKITVQKR